MNSEDLSDWVFLTLKGIHCTACHLLSFSTGFMLTVILWEVL
jgi:hypothetical protein